jgi:hypothetical protein
VPLARRAQRGDDVVDILDALHQQHPARVACVCVCVCVWGGCGRCEPPRIRPATHAPPQAWLHATNTHHASSTPTHLSIFCSNSWFLLVFFQLRMNHARDTGYDAADSTTLAPHTWRAQVGGRGGGTGACAALIRRVRCCGCARKKCAPPGVTTAATHMHMHMHILMLMHMLTCIHAQSFCTLASAVTPRPCRTR